MIEKKKKTLVESLNKHICVCQEISQFLSPNFVKVRPSYNTRKCLSKYLAHYTSKNKCIKSISVHFLISFVTISAASIRYLSLTNMDVSVFAYNILISIGELLRTCRQSLFMYIPHPHPHRIREYYAHSLSLEPPPP